MKQKTYLLYAFILILLMSACGMNGGREYDRMLQALLQSQSDDKNKVNRTNDSTMLVVAEYFDRHGEPQHRALAWFELGRISSDIGLTGQAINAYKRAFDTDTLSSDSTLLSIRAKAAVWMGQTLIYQDLYTQAMPHFMKARTLAEQCGDTETLTFATRDIARCYVAQENMKEGEKWFQTASQIAVNHHDTILFKAVQMEMSDLYGTMEDYGKMKQCLDACRDYSEGDSGIVINQMANYYLAIGRKDSALMYFKRVIHDDNPYVRRDATLNLADLRADEGNFREAYDLLAKSIYEDDSLTAVEQGQNANLIKTLSDKMEREKAQDSRLRRQANIIHSLVLALVCLFLFIYFTIKHKNLQNRMQREKAAQLMKELRKADKTERPIREQRIRAFMESEIYASFHNPIFKPSLQDYHLLEDALNNTYDGCIDKIRGLHDDLKDKEIQLCMLEKAEVSNKLICFDLAMEPNALSMLRVRLYAKLFKEKGTADKFHDFIKRL